MKRVKKQTILLSLLMLSVVVTGCGSEGGQKIKLTDTSATDRATQGQQQWAQREAAARAADAKINGAGPYNPIRIGQARSTSMEGTNWIQGNNIPTSVTSPSTTVTKKNDNSLLIMTGLGIFAIFGKEIIKGSGDALGAAKDAVKDAIGSDPKNSKEIKKEETSTSTTAKTESIKVQETQESKSNVESTTAMNNQAAKLMTGDGVTSSKAQPTSNIAEPARALNQEKVKLALAQCNSGQTTKGGELESFLSEVKKKVSELGVKS